MVTGLGANTPPSTSELAREGFSDFVRTFKPADGYHFDNRYLMSHFGEDRADGYGELDGDGQDYYTWRGGLIDFRYLDDIRNNDFYGLTDRSSDDPRFDLIVSRLSTMSNPAYPFDAMGILPLREALNNPSVEDFGAPLDRLEHSVREARLTLVARSYYAEAMLETALEQDPHALEQMLNGRNIDDLRQEIIDARQQTYGELGLDALKQFQQEMAKEAPDMDVARDAFQAAVYGLDQSEPGIAVGSPEMAAAMGMSEAELGALIEQHGLADAYTRDQDNTLTPETEPQPDAPEAGQTQDTPAPPPAGAALGG